MHTTLALGDFFAIFMIVGFLARGSHAVQGITTLQELRAQRQLDAIMKHLDLPEPPVSRAGALSAEVLALLAAGQRNEAMRRYRQETGETVQQAKAAIEMPPAVATAGR